MFRLVGPKERYKGFWGLAIGLGLGALLGFGASKMFKRPEIPPMPEPEPVPPPPEPVEDTAAEMDEEMKYRRSRLSRPKAIITGDLTPSTGKKGTLG